MGTGDTDRDVRLFVYRDFIEQGHPPTVQRVADEIGLTAQEVEHSFRRLEAAHVLVFAPGTLDVWMANPLSAFPTPFWVQTTRGSWWGTCIWDAFGIPAMLGSDATISTSCPDCNEVMDIRIQDASLVPTHGLAHFAVPARNWWDNIGYT
jgi:hypothetical protein